MKPFYAAALAAALLTTLAADRASAQKSSLTEKLNAYVGCINRLSERSYDSRSRYFSWAAKSGPTGKERIIYGTYAIYDTSDCKKNVEKANAMEPHDTALETAATAYADAVSKLEPLLKETDDYYSQENYKDDKMAKGKACILVLSPRGMRLPAPTRSCAERSKPSTTGALWRSSPRSRKAKGARRATMSSVDDPGQARAARRGCQESRRRRDHAGAE